MRAKMPLGDWLYAYFRLIGIETNIIITVRGNRELLSGNEDIGTNRVEAFVNVSSHVERFSLYNPNGWSGKFHLYQIIWDSGEYLTIFYTCF